MRIFEEQTAVIGEGACFLLLARGRDKSTRYGCIEDVTLGNVSSGVSQPAQNTVLLLGADGHRRCGALYASHVPSGADVRAFSSLYGSMPCGQAFDVAIAAEQSGEQFMVAGALEPTDAENLTLANVEGNFLDHSLVVV